MRARPVLLASAAIAAALSISSGCSRPPEAPPAAPGAKAGKPAPAATLAALGEKLFFDAGLSQPPGQSCAACHAPEVGWTGPDEAVNKGGGVYPGAVHSRFGNRKPPSVAYAAAPVLSTKVEDGKTVFVGGSFWDGRATGERLGSTLAEQAQGPFLNPLEQNMPDAAAVVAAVCKGEYAALFRDVARKEKGLEDACAPAGVAVAYEVVGLAIAAFETSPKAQPFSSRYDGFLAGKDQLTDEEKRGLALFAGKARCSQCHPHEKGADGAPPLFTDFGYDNIGLPPNPANPFYGMGKEHNPDGAKWRDPGLGGFLTEQPRWAAEAAANQGKHKSPTLRNVNRRPSPAFVKAFGHNGVLKSLEEVVHFYNTRDTLPDCAKVKRPEPGKTCWPAAEEPRTVEKARTGNLGLTPDEEAAIVAFLETLDDAPESSGEPAARAAK